MEREYRYPLVASIVPAVLADQRDFFFFLFVLVKHAASSLCTITTLGINLRNGLCQDIIRNRYRRACSLIQARQSPKMPLLSFLFDRCSRAVHSAWTLWEGTFGFSSFHLFTKFVPSCDVHWLGVGRVI
jgi:hypothetical protein